MEETTFTERRAEGLTGCTTELAPCQPPTFSGLGRDLLKALWRRSAEADREMWQVWDSMRSISIPSDSDVRRMRKVLARRWRFAVMLPQISAGRSVVFEESHARPIALAGTVGGVA